MKKTAAILASGIAATALLAGCSETKPSAGKREERSASAESTAAPTTSAPACPGAGCPDGTVTSPASEWGTLLIETLNKNLETGKSEPAVVKDGTLSIGGETYGQVPSGVAVLLFLDPSETRACAQLIGPGVNEAVFSGGTAPKCPSEYIIPLRIEQ